MNNKTKTSYKIYNEKAKIKTKINLLKNVYPPLPKDKFSIIYADPPWHYDVSKGSIIMKPISAFGFFGGTNKFICLKTPPLGSFITKFHNF